MIDHFNKSFSNAVSNDELQSVDKHMVKFKGRSSMKQYVKWEKNYSSGTSNSGIAVQV